MMTKNWVKVSAAAALVLLLVFVDVSFCDAFTKSSSSSSSSTMRLSRFGRIAKASSSTRLNDISEWRDIMFDDNNSLSDVVDYENKDDGPLREVCILPFPCSDVILQGETKELRLYEDR